MGSNKPAKKVAIKKAVQATKAVPTPAATGRIYFKQSEFPLLSLQQAQKIAAAIVDNFKGTGGSPPDIALAIGISPTSSAWPSLADASIGYGLTAGGVNANTITITDLGRKLVAPEEEGADITARRVAIMKPRLMKEFFEKYRRANSRTKPLAPTSLRGMVFRLIVSEAHYRSSWTTEGTLA